MTGRDLIIYILANGLEDEPVFNDGTLIGFESEAEFAERMDVGIATVRTWVDTGMIEWCIRIGDAIYIPRNYTLYFKAK